MPTQTFNGSFYNEEYFGASLISTAVLSATVTDTDATRGNGSAESLTYQSGIPFSAPQTIDLARAKEIIAIVQLKDGAVSSVKGVVVENFLSYGSSTFQYLFDDAALAAAGKSLNDIGQVLSRTVIDHGLNWADLGFDFNGISPPNQITGTRGNDFLIGTAGDDDVRGLAGSDTFEGSAGHDSFIFGAETRNGVRESDIVRGYTVGQDDIALEAGVANVRSVRNISGGVQITLTGDGDIIKVFGTGVNASTITLNDYDIT